MDIDTDRLYDILLEKESPTVAKECLELFERVLRNSNDAEWRRQTENTGWPNQTKNMRLKIGIEALDRLAGYSPGLRDPFI